VRLRKSLSKQGYDAGAATIAQHLTRDPTVTDVPAISTIWRILHERGSVTDRRRARHAKRARDSFNERFWNAETGGSSM
jgi:hypothetical protein